jgi:hypothetical protein
MSKQLVAAIEKQEGLAVARGDLTEERADAIDHYLGRPYGNEQEGRSKVVMRDVADTIEWIKPSLMKVFCSGDEVVKFDAVGPEDEQQAQQETDYCNHIVMQKNNGFLVFHDWFHDALLQKNGYVMAQYVTERRPNKERYERLSDDELALLLQGEEIEVLEHSEYLDEVNGGMYHDVVIRCMKEYGCTKLMNIAPERVLVAGDWPNVNLEGCPFVEVIDYPTISHLRQVGYEVDDNISDTAQYSDDEWTRERRDSTGQDESVEDIEADPSTRRVKTRYVWMQYDEDGDGIAELRHIVIIGTTILHNEEEDTLPVACLTPLRQPHEHFGLSIDDVVSDLQEIRTTLMRGYLDNMYLANNGRYAIDSNIVNLDDMLVARPGGVVRTNGSTAGAIMPLIHPQDGNAILQAVEMVDSIRENRTGVTKYNQGLDANSLNKTATGITQIMTAAQQRIELIARIFAETGVKALMLIVHAMSIKHGRKQEIIKLRNNWVPVDPRNWKTRKDVTVSVGLGTGNKDQMLQHLMLILQAQKEALMIGVATPQNVYNALVKLTQNAGFKNAEEFWTDPSKAPPQQQGPSPEQVKAQADMQKEQMKQQADVQKFQAQMQADQQRMAFEASEKEKDRQLELEKVRIQEATKVALAQFNAESSAQLETTKHSMSLEKQEKDNSPVVERIDSTSQEVSAVIGDLIQVMHAMRQDMSRPRIPMRDANGKVIGARPARDDELQTLQ